MLTNVMLHLYKVFRCIADNALATQLEATLR